MRERERNGVRLGQPVRDLDGTSLGRVVRLFDWGFQTRRGLPILSRGQHVVRYDEVRAVREGALVVSRSGRDLLELAAGEIPHAWRIPTPSAFPTAATPSEARSVLEDVAAGRVPGGALDEEARKIPLPARTAPERTSPEPRPRAADEVRTFGGERGQAVAPNPTNHR
jgi:hypothetical protein